MESVPQEIQRTIQYLLPQAATRTSQPDSQTSTPIQARRAATYTCTPKSNSKKRRCEDIVKEVHSPTPCDLAMASGSPTSSARRIMSARPPTTPRRPGTAGSSLDVARSPATVRALDFDFGEDQIESSQNSYSQHSLAGGSSTGGAINSPFEHVEDMASIFEEEE